MFSLARELKIGTVAELQQRMSSRELAEWMAYFKLENEDNRRRESEAKAAKGAEARSARAVRMR